MCIRFANNVTLLSQQSTQLPLTFTASVGVNYFPKPDVIAPRPHLQIRINSAVGETLGETVRELHRYETVFPLEAAAPASDTCTVQRVLDDANPTHGEISAEIAALYCRCAYFVLSPLIPLLQRVDLA